jgi:hypothetical protein
MRLSSLLAGFALVACSSTSAPVTDPPATATATPPPETAAPTASTAPGSTAPTATATASAPAAPTPPVAAKTWTGFASPESVLVHKDRIFVSNINGKGLDADNNGFISELSADGTVKTLKLFEGGKAYKLNAPKGLAAFGDTLYVADIDTVRSFDLKKGTHKADIPIPKATFLNDLVASEDGKIYVSDSGLKAGRDGFEPSGTDAIHVIERGKVKLVASAEKFNRPNGLALINKKDLVVTTYGSNEVFVLGNDEAEMERVTKTPKGALDGVAAAGGLLVSSWEGGAIYHGTLGTADGEGKFEVVMEGLKAPADITFDAKRGWILVPRLLEDKVEAYEFDPPTRKLKQVKPVTTTP